MPAVPDMERAATLDPHAQRFLSALALSGPGQPGVAERREGLRVLTRLAAGEPVPADVRPLVLGLGDAAQPARLYVPPDATTSGPGMVYFHGGGLVTGDLDTHDAICRQLCASAACRIVAVGYRLAPEHPFPAALEDATAAVRSVAERADSLGIDPARLGIAGDSAGAGLAARVCQEARAAGPRLAAQLLICPVLDLACATASHRTFASGYFLDAQTVRHDIACAGVAAMVDDPRVSPMREPDLADLPPAHIHTAGFDVVRDDGLAYAERLRGAGVAVDYRCHEAMIHFFYGLGRLVPRSQPLLAEIGAAFGALLHGGRADPVPLPA